MTANPTAVEQIACPVCESLEIDDSLDGLDGVCTACGFVIHDATNLTPPDWLYSSDTSQESESEDWITVCRVRNATEQQIAQAFASLENIADHLTLGADIRSEAADVYTDCFRLGTTDGRDTHCLVAVCLRVGSIRATYPVPVGRLIAAQDVDASQFRQSYSAVRDELNLAVEVPSPVEYLSFLSDGLSMDSVDVETARGALMDLSADPSLAGKDPVGIAGAAIYLSGNAYTQSDVAEATGVSTETIRQRVAQIQELREDD